VTGAGEGRRPQQFHNSRRHFGHGAIVILDVLGVAAAFKGESVREKDEPRCVAERRADHGEAHGAHARFGVREAVGDEAKHRFVMREIVGKQAPGEVRAARERAGAWSFSV